MSYYENGNEGGERSIDYWATRSGMEYVGAVHALADKFLHHLDETGRLSLYRRSHNAYYGLDSNSSWSDAAAVRFGGEQGENVMIRSNHYRSLNDHVLVLTTGSRPSFSARAANADYRSQAQAKLSEGILDYYLTTKRIEDLARRVASYALRYTEGWLFVGWDASEGEAVDATQQPRMEDGEPVTDEMGQPVMEEVPVYEGDVTVRAYEPQDVIRDVTADSPQDLQWVILHRRVNRWDLAAKYPEHADAIKSAPEVATGYAERVRGTRAATRRGGEYVSIFEVWHEQTDAVPDGRHSVICGDALLIDGVLPFDEIPVVPMMPAVEDGTAFGFTGMVDLLALQEARDGVLSIATTNLDAFGRQTIWAEAGSGFDVRDIGGLTVCESSTPPQVLQFLQAQGTILEVAELYRQEMEQLSGVNSVARGEPQASLKSGSALALVHSMAIQYNAAIQSAYAQLFERMGTMILSRLKTFANTRRMAEITGKQGRAELVEFSAEDLQGVQRVVVELGSAVLRTSAGRKELADKFFEAGVATPQQYLEVMSTGRLDPIVERPQSQRMNIIRENDMMIEGESPVVLITDDHAQHIQEHLTILDDPSVRADNTLSAIALEHIQGHINYWSTMDPVLLAATGQQPPPVPMAPPMPGGAPMPPGGAPNPGGDMPVNVEGATDMPNPPIGAEQATMPTMPDLPAGTDPSVAEAQMGANQ